MLTTLLCVAASNALAAFVQASTGFGYAIVAMFLLPFFLPYEQCLVVSAVTIIAIAIQMGITLRHYIRIKKILWPMIGCLSMLWLGRYLIGLVNDTTAAHVMGIFLVLLSLVFFLSKKRGINVRESSRNGLIFGFLTGLTTGMFNIVGPFFSIYYYDVFDSPLEFKANLECSFLIAGVVSLVINLMTVSSLNATLLLSSGLSAAFAIPAGMLGLAIFRKLNQNHLKWIIIAALAVMGIVQLFRR